MTKRIFLLVFSVIFSTVTFGCTSQNIDETMTAEDMYNQFYALHEQYQSDEKHSAYSGLVLEMVRLAIRLEDKIEDENIGNILNEYSGLYPEFPCYVGRLKNGNEIIAFSTMQYNNEYLYEGEVNKFRDDENEMKALNSDFVIWESIDKGYSIVALDVYIGGSGKVNLDVLINGRYSPYRDMKETEDTKEFLNKYNKKIFKKNKGIAGDWNYCLFKMDFEKENGDVQDIDRINVIVNDENVELVHIFGYMKNYNGTYARDYMEEYIK